jgi:hypothetical protein
MQGLITRMFNKNTNAPHINGSTSAYISNAGADDSPAPLPFHPAPHISGGASKNARLRRFLITVMMLIASLWSLMQIAVLDDTRLDNIELSVNEQAYVPVKLPVKQNIIGEYRVRLTLNPRSDSARHLRVTPDDELISLSVNGQNISLANYTKTELRDYRNGFTLTLENLTSQSDNLVEFTLANKSNPAGFNARLLKSTSALANIGITLALLLLAFCLLRHLPIARSQYVFLFLGVAASVFYLSKTESDTRTFDVYEGGGHRDYIEYLITHRSAPPPGEGWEYHQPPLYYTVAAISKAVFANPSLHSDFWGQLLALWFWCIFLIASLSTIHRAFRKKSWALFIASAAVCLWPAGIIHSIRIGNDVAIYAFYALAFYYCVIWWKGRASGPLFWAAFWASMALLTKSNALAIWGVIGLLFLAQGLPALLKQNSSRRRRVKVLRHAAILAGYFSFTLALNFGDNVWHYFDGSSNDWLLSNVSESIHPGLKVTNTPANYLIFDVATYLQQPFISTWDDKFGRQYFWNFVWRSALSSEFFFAGKTMAVWGLVNGLLLLLMLAGIAIYTLQQHTLQTPLQYRRSLYKNLPWLLALALPFILLLAYRIKVPLSCNTDFRYIYPVLLPLLYFSAKPWHEAPQLKLARALALSAPLIAFASWIWLVNL